MLARTTLCASLEPVRSHALLALALVCALVLSAGIAFAAPPAAESIVVVSMQGDVRVTSRNQVRAVKPGAIVAPPATIRTGRDGVIELRQGSTTVSVAADTQIDIATSSGGDGLLERVVQPKGNVFYAVAKRKAQKLRVETPYLVAVIKGTQFNVAAQDESATVSLFEGHLEIWTPDDSDVVQLNAGEIATRGRNDRAIRVLRMDTGEMIRARNDASSDETDSRFSASVTGLVDAARPDTLVPIAGSASLANGPNGIASAALESPKATPVGIESSLAASVGVGGAGDAPAVSAGVAAAVDLGGVAAASMSTAATVALASPSIDVAAAATVPAVPVAVDVAASLGAAPAIDVGVAAAPVDVGLGVDPGIGTIPVDLGVTLPPAAPPAPAIVDDLVKPLRGLLGR